VNVRVIITHYIATQVISLQVYRELSTLLVSSFIYGLYSFKVDGNFL